MPFDFATAKAQVRRLVQDTFAVPAFYSDNSISVPVEIRARWHNKLTQVGELARGDGYAQTIENIDRIVLIPEIWIPDPVTGVSMNSREILTLKRNGRIIFPVYDNAEFILSVSDTSNGPLEMIWQVTRA